MYNGMCSFTLKECVQHVADHACPRSTLAARTLARSGAWPRCLMPAAL